MPILYLSNAGSYAYMEHLVALDSMRPQSGLVPEELCRIVTPLHWQVWDRKLSQHSDQRFRSYIIEGIRYGFRVGFDYTRLLKSATSSSRHHPQLISEYLPEECAEGRIMGPLARDFSTRYIVSAHRRILGMASVVCVLVKICVSSISLYKLDTDKLTTPFESVHQFTLVCTVSKTIYAQITVLF